MRVLLSPGDSDLVRSLRGRLTGHAAVLDDGQAPSGGPGGGTAPAAVDAPSGVDAVVVDGLPGGGESGPVDPSAALDRATRLTYDLLRAAAESGVSRCVYLSSLRLLADYPDHYTVTEGWRTLPPSGDAALLGCHLGEIVVREFARERRLQVVTLRLGYPVVPGARAALNGAHGDAAICTDDVAAAVGAALTAPVGAPCTVVHVQSPVPEARYLMDAAKDLLGYPKGGPS